METVAAMARTGLVVVALLMLMPLLILAGLMLYLFPSAERFVYTKDYRRLCFPAGKGIAPARSLSAEP